MSAKNRFNKILFVSILITVLIMLTSCTYESDIKQEDNKTNLIVEVENKSIVTPVNKSYEKEIIPENISEEKPEPEEQEEKEEEQVSLRASEVEFYFLLIGESYFKHILKEQQKKIYNISGYLVTIEPIIITPDSVKFRINNYTTKALEEDDSDSTERFEIIVKDIYYRK